MLIPEVVIVVDVEGKSTVEAKGVVGNRCYSLTSEFEYVIGRRVWDRTKPELTQIATGLQAGQA